ncbi:MAG: hypothetical protein K6C99_08665 [Lachnospiraceae bacterium]|nr:hypothetical protein [Lachnospiraceae bacterium]
MDNFMDKLAERYNAQDMIKANSQAEKAEMNNLEEQVEAYEAVLQEMRKLNYRNTELTEKMVALVDESMQKVKTLQIEAAGGGMDTEAISREMSDAVSKAVGTAVSNMDESMMQSLSDSLKRAIEQPAEELKQSSAAVQTSADSVRNATDEVKSGVEGVQSAVNDLKNDMAEVRKSIDGTREDIEYIRLSVEDAAEKAPVAGGLTAEDKEEIKNEIASVKAAVEALNTDSGSDEEIKSEIASVKAAVEALNTDSGSDEEIKSEIASVKAAIAELKAAVEEVASGETKRDEATEASDKSFAEELKNALTEAYGAIEGANNNVSATRGAVEEAKLGIADTKAAVEAGKSSLDVVRAGVDETKTGIEGIQGTADEIRVGLASIEGRLNELSEGSNAEVKESIDQINSVTAELKAAMLDIYDSLNDAKKSISDVRSQQTALAQGQADSIKEDKRDLRVRVTDIGIVAGRLETAIEELKIAVEKLDADEEKDEEGLDEVLEERFKANEEFMHKESVKVYRNVQAILNEKSEKQSDSSDLNRKTIEQRISRVHGVAVFGLIVGLINLAVIILRIFGII